MVNFSFFLLQQMAMRPHFEEEADLISLTFVNRFFYFPIAATTIFVNYLRILDNKHGSA
jgi:hypothetical protein